MKKIKLKDLLSIASCGFDIWITNEETEEYFYGYCDKGNAEDLENNDAKVLNAEVKHFNEDIIVVYIKDYVDKSQQW